jgi:hypothetical protein
MMTRSFRIQNTMMIQRTYSGLWAGNTCYELEYPPRSTDHTLSDVLLLGVHYSVLILWKTLSLSLSLSLPTRSRDDKIKSDVIIILVVFKVLYSKSKSIDLYFVTWRWYVSYRYMSPKSSKFRSVTGFSPAEKFVESENWKCVRFSKIKKNFWGTQFFFLATMRLVCFEGNIWSTTITRNTSLLL